jgi:hypothetical protein
VAPTGLKQPLDPRIRARARSPKPNKKNNEKPEKTNKSFKASTIKLLKKDRPTEYNGVSSNKPNN